MLTIAQSMLNYEFAKDHAYTADECVEEVLGCKCHGRIYSIEIVDQTWRIRYACDHGVADEGVNYGHVDQAIKHALINFRYMHHREASKWVL